MSDQKYDAISEALKAAEEIGADPAPQGPPETAEDARPLEAGAVALPLNDYGNGCRMVHYYGADLAFVPRLGWHRWDGRRWAADEDGLEVRRVAQKIAGHIAAERFYIEAPDHLALALSTFEAVAEEHADLCKKGRDEITPAEAERLAELRELEKADCAARKVLSKLRADHMSFSKSSGNSGRITNMMMECEPELSIRVDQLNANGLDICCESGVLQLRLIEDPHAAEWGDTRARASAELVAHDRAHMITKMVAAPYAPAAPRPAFERFLDQILPDPEVRGFLKRWFGYCLTGETGEQKLAFLYGHGRNGKSTLVDVIAKILADYGTSLPIESLTGTEQRKGSDATPDLVRLPGARFVRASEPEQGQKMKEALVKALTGGEPILVRRMMKEFVEIEPQFKLTISGNYKPEVRGADDGIWRRIMLVPFDQQIPEEDVDPLLKNKLWQERAGIFAWMVEGAIEWMETGLRPPASIVAATADYRRESDPVRLFLETECMITGDDEDRVSAKVLGEAFNLWMVGNGDDAWKPRTTGAAIKKRAETVRSAEGHAFRLVKASTNFYYGIRLGAQAAVRAELAAEHPGYPAASAP